MSAEVIPDEANERNAVAECPKCEWRSPVASWWSTAQERADRHNRRFHTR